MNNGEAPELAVYGWSTPTGAGSDTLGALSRLYTSLNELSQLRTTTAQMVKGDKTVTEVMIRHGSWPAWLPSVDARLDQTLCSLNVEAGNCVFSEGAGEPRWSAGVGDEIVVPNYAFYETYRARIVPTAKLQDGFAIAAEPNAVDKVLCSFVSSESCQPSPLGSRSSTASPLPLVLTASDREPDYQNVPQDWQAAIEGLLADDSDRRIVAFPELRLAEPLRLELSGPNAPNEEDFADFNSNISPNALRVKGLQLEGKKIEILMQDLDLFSEQVMGFRDLDNKKLSFPLTQDAVEKEIVIIHFDQEVTFEHCFFKPFEARMAIYNISELEGDSTKWSEGFRVPSESDCELSVNEQINPLASHGTHTLGTLLRYIETPGFYLPGNENNEVILSPDNTKIYHFPLLQDGGTLANAQAVIDTLNQIRNLSDLLNFDPIVVISASWDPLGAEPIAELIGRELDNAHFIVAAPRNEIRNTCGRHPAGILDDQGRPLKNVISVVGFDADPNGDDGYTWHEFASLEYGSYGRCHDVGAIGAQLGPTIENTLATKRGSSQAAPVVAAAAAHILRLAPRRLKPEELAARLIATSLPPAASDPAAMGALINFADAISFDESVIVVGSDGVRCKYFGDFEALGPNNLKSLPFKRIRSPETMEVNRSRLHRLHRREDGTFWVVHEGWNGLEANDYRLGDNVQFYRRIVFDIQRGDPNNPEGCLFSEGRSEYRVQDVFDLLVRRM